MTEKIQEISKKYLALKSKVPTAAEKLEIAQKLSTVRELEQDNARLEDLLRLHGVNLPKDKSRIKENLDR